MRGYRFLHSVAFKMVLGLLCVFVIGIPAGLAQSSQDNSQDHGSYAQHTHSLPLADSTAEKEADRLVSLSADKIISILNNESGLLLECKRLLVRTAYEQGRILNFDDLEDEVVFRLIRQDENIRVLFTHEIEDRLYVAAKPTREQLARGETPALPMISSQQPGLASTKSQEDSYWSAQGNGISNFSLPAGGQSSQPQQSNPPQQSQPPSQSNPLDLLHSLQMAQAQAGAGGLDNSGMPQISPDQMSALVAAKMAGGGGGGSLLGSLGGGGEEGGGSSLGKGLDTGSMMGAAGMSSLGALGGSFDPYKDEDTAQSSHNAPPAPSSASDTKQPVLAHRPNPYADVPSLFDLYSQYSRTSPTLQRFGAEIFKNGTGNSDTLPMDMPVGPDYVIGPGDGLNIDLFGSVGQRLRRVVSREGKVALPDAGDVQVAGRTLGDVQHMVQATLRTQFRDVEADVSITRLRSVRVYVVGDVQRPGGYDVSSLSTPLNAVFEAGGPTSQGSIRTIKHYRGKELVQTVDVYDLLLHGVNSSLQHLEPGDTLLVPPVAQEVTVSGMVRRPAIYELSGETNLAQLLEVAGGVLPSGTLRHVDVERVVAHETRTMMRLDIPENNNEASVNKALEDFQVQDGDKIQISPILPYANKTVYLEGHVFRPGKFAYRDGMTVTDLIHSYQDVMPEPYKEHAEIVRLKAPDNTPEVVAFNLDDVLSGKTPNLALQPFDTIRVFGRFDFEDAPIVTVTGAVRDPGDHVTNGATYLRDAVYLAGNTTADAELDDAQVFRKTQDGKLEVISVNLAKALEGDSISNILLEPKDRVFVHKNLARTDPPTVTIEGEVARPGKYPLSEDMTAAGLVRFAGGLKRSAFSQEADLTRYEVSEGSKIVSDHVTVPIASALANVPDTDVRLRDGDVLTIRQLTGWKDMGATIKVEGEVLHPGTYGIQEGERLSSIIERAGGLRKDAYPYGAVFQRAEIRELQERNRLDLIRRVESESAEVKVVPGMTEDQQMTAQAAVLQYKTTLEKLENTPPVGRMVIHISSDVKRWRNTPTDIQVRAGDSIYVPKRPNIVLVDGSVYNPTGITFKPGKNAEWYLSQAGGPTQLANKKAVFVVRADGSVMSGPGGLFSGGIDRSALQPGDMVVVPEKSYSINNKWQTTLEAGQLFSSVGILAYYATHF